MNGNQFTEEELNAVAEELFESATVMPEEPEQEPEQKPEPVSQLSPVGQEEVADALTKASQDPIVPKHMTRQVWKQMMRIHFTVRRGVAPGCGHKLSSINVPNEKGENTVFITSDPRKNCDSCWFTYFNTNGQMTNIADECFREAGRDVLERSRGKRFVKYFFLVTFQYAVKDLFNASKSNPIMYYIFSPDHSGRGDYKATPSFVYIINCPG